MGGCARALRLLRHVDRLCHLRELDFLWVGYCVSVLYSSPCATSRGTIPGVGLSCGAFALPADDRMVAHQYVDHISDSITYRSCSRCARDSCLSTDVARKIGRELCR